MSKRKFKIKAKESDLLSILVRLGVSNDQEVWREIELEDSKDIYKALSSDPDIIDWDLLSDEESDTLISLPTPEEEDAVCTLRYQLEITGYNELATFIEAVWKLSKVSPSLIFDSRTWNESVKDLYASTAVDDTNIMNHTILRMVLETYYSGNDFNDNVFEDTMNKLKQNWKGLPEETVLSGVANRLYRKI